MDGKEVASDNKGKEINLELSTNKPNLCFGRDVQGAGHFAKFSIGSFSTFNTFLTPSMMSNVYTFFFRSGKYHIGSNPGDDARYTRQYMYIWYCVKFTVLLCKG